MYGVSSDDGFVYTLDPSSGAVLDKVQAFYPSGRDVARSACS